MRAIDVGVGHDDDLVVAQLVDVSLFGILAIDTEAYTDTLDDIHYRFSLEHAVPLHFLHIQDLTAQGQDSLEMTVTTLLGRTTCGVTLDEEDLTVLRILV